MSVHCCKSVPILIWPQMLLGWKTTNKQTHYLLQSRDVCSGYSAYIPSHTHNKLLTNFLISCTMKPHFILRRTTGRDCCYHCLSSASCTSCGITTHAKNKLTWLQFGSHPSEAQTHNKEISQSRSGLGLKKKLISSYLFKAFPVRNMCRINDNCVHIYRVTWQVISQAWWLIVMTDKIDKSGNGQEAAFDNMDLGLSEIWDKPLQCGYLRSTYTLVWFYIHTLYIHTASHNKKRWVSRRSQLSLPSQVFCIIRIGQGPVCSVSG